MNLYIRYFDQEVLVNTADDAIAFLSNIDDINMDAMLEEDIRSYYASNVCYPKRYKVRPRVYFIVIKTDAKSMEEFKDKGASRSESAPQAPAKQASPTLARLNEEKFGWYEGTLNFKRVQIVPVTGKFQYRDTTFVACCKANSGIECYKRIVDHLRERVDPRSQFPSVKGKNFKFRFMGACK